MIKPAGPNGNDKKWVPHLKLAHADTLVGPHLMTDSQN